MTRAAESRLEAEGKEMDGTIISMFPDGRAQGTDAREGTVSPDPFQGRDFLAGEFLLWLWFRSEHDFGVFKVPGGPIDLWFDDKLTFLSMEEKKVVSAFDGGAPSTTPEAKLSILSGKVITEARLGLRQGDNEWSFVVRARSGQLQLHGLKIPAVIKEGADEMIYERVFLVNTVIQSLQALFVWFFRERSSEAWHATTVPAMSRWLMGEE